MSDFYQMRRTIASSASRQGGVALIIVLAFLVILTGLVVAFFSSAVSERQISNSSAHQTKVALFAEGAVESLLGDLKQEIAAGSITPSSTPSPAPNTNLFFPKSGATAVPYRVGTADTLPNLVKRSAYQQPFYAGANYDTANFPASNRAANVSTTTISQNMRSLSVARWNKALLLPKQTPSSDTDFTPVTGTNGYTAPDWVLVARDGTNPTVWSTALANASGSSFVVGRYAYNVYDEGGLLDMNVAGYPTGVTGAQAGSKYALAFADLTQLKDASGNSLFTQSQIDAFISWRNYATTQAPADFPTPAFTATSGLNYFNSIAASTTGFLTTGNTALYNGQSDRMLASRQQLMKLLLSGIAAQDSTATAVVERANLQNALQYLGTFSREVNQPSYIPAVQANPAAPVVFAANLGGNSAAGGDKLINPSFLSVRVPTPFTRNDGTTANQGDPLVNKRFALQRLAWITYNGPSATRTQSDPDIQALINDGIPWSYLQLGTAAAIQKYFGLTWDATNNRWKYNVHNGGGTGQGLIMLVGRPAGTAANASKYVQDANREPDFFELLKAGITVGSLGKAAVTSSTGVVNGAAPNNNIVPPGYSASQVPANLRYNFDTSVDYHVIQIGANILSEVNPTSYPIRIAYDDGVVPGRGLWEFQGVTDLPYLGYVFNGVLRTKRSIPAADYNNTADASPLQYPRPAAGKVTDSGNAYVIQVPTVWNPYDPNGTPGVLRPQNFRVVIDSNDPVNLANGAANEYVWCAAEASTRTSGTTGGNEGLGTTPSDFSFNATANPTSKIGSRINDSVTFQDSNGTLYREPTLIFRTAVGNANRTAGNITSIDANPLAGGNDPPGTLFAPLVLGSFPLAFQSGANVLFGGTAVIGHGDTSLAGNNRAYFTYRLQYEYPAGSGTWVTYDTKYGRTTHGQFSFHTRANFSPCVIKGPDVFNPFSWAGAMDPRSARFGPMLSVINYGRSKLYTSAPPPDNGATNGWVYNSSGSADIQQSITYPIRPDSAAGFYFTDTDRGDMPPGGRRTPDSNNNALLDGIWEGDAPFPSFAAGWTRPLMYVNEGHGANDIYIFTPGLYAQNNPSAPFYVGRYNADGTFSDPAEGPVGPAYYGDADGVVRRGGAAYVPAGVNASGSTPVGLPTTGIQGYPNQPASLLTPWAGKHPPTPFNQSQSRPLLLHRPFRTVAELGYVFRDLPWKNLDFFTPESGDAALLDIFCINETTDPIGLAAGKVNLNTRQAPVLTAIISGAYVDDPRINNATVGTISGTTNVANTIARALMTRTADTTNYGPLLNVSELVGTWKAPVANAPPAGITYKPAISTGNSANCAIDLKLADGYKDGKASYTGFSGAPAAATPVEDLGSAYAAATFSTDAATNTSLQASMSGIQRFREAPLRALASVGQTRVWNLMIDVVAQTGRYPQSANSLDQFIVEGEQRCWIHVAIDRLTGTVIDKQIEVVKE